MNYQNAWDLVETYVSDKKVKIDDASKIRREDYFRISLGTFADLSFLKENKCLIVRSCMVRIPDRVHPLLEKNIKKVTNDFRDYLPEDSFFEIDHTALEVDPFHPCRINLRKDYTNEIDYKTFKKEVDLLNRKAKDWVLLYLKEVMDKLKADK